MSSQPASTQNNNWVFILAACAAGWFLSSYVNKPNVPGPDVVPVVSVSKALDASYKADRASKLAILREISKMDASKDELRLKRFNELSEQNRLKDFQPYVDLVAEALAAGTLEDLANNLEKGK